MLVATFNATTAWQGRAIVWDADRFVLVDHGRIPAAGVLDYDRLGQLDWPRPELRTWVADVHRWESGASTPAWAASSPTWAASAPGGPASTPAWAASSQTWAASAPGTAGHPGPQPAAGPARTSQSGLPTWAIVSIALTVVLVIVGIIIAILVPAMILRSSEAMAGEGAVRAGVRTIQGGIESYGTAHGFYPPADEVSQVGLSAYITDWPTDPYTSLPMSDIGGAGNFSYEVSSDGGAYRIVGYGKDGKVLIELTGGTQTTV